MERVFDNQMLATVGFVLADAVVLTFFLRAVVARDGLFKPFMLALPIAILSLLSLDHLYLSQSRRTLGEI
jgi:hypothetical protein